MPRKAFVADLQEAIKHFKRVNVSNIKAGDDDGQINFNYQYDGTSTEIVALVPGTSSLFDRQLEQSCTQTASAKL